MSKKDTPAASDLYNKFMHGKTKQQSAPTGQPLLCHICTLPYHMFSRFKDNWITLKKVLAFNKLDSPVDLKPL